MKRLLAAIAIIGILVLGLPNLIGRLVEQHVDRTIAYINQQHQNFSLEKASLDRHWFSSDITLRVFVPKQNPGQTTAESVLPFSALRNASDNKPVIITLHSTLYHGPLMMAENIAGKHRLEMGLGYVRLAAYPKDIENPSESVNIARLATLIKDQPLFVVTNRIGFLNGDTIKFASAPIHHQDADGKIDWDGIQAEVTLNSRSNKLTMSATSAALSFEGKEAEKIATSAVTLKASHHKDSNGLWIGNTTLDLPSLAVSNKQGQSVELKSATLNVGTRTQKDLFAGNINADFTDLQHNGKQYGPFALKTSIEHVDAKALAAIAQYHTTTDQAHSAVANLVRQNELLTAVSQVLSNQPKLIIDTLSLKTPDGVVTLHGNVELGEQAKHSNGLLQFESFLNSLQIAMDLTLPSPLAEHATIVLAGFYPTLLLTSEELNNPETTFTEEQLEERAHERLQNWVASKLVTNAGNAYTVSFKLVNGVPSVNGSPIKLAEPTQATTPAPVEENTVPAVTIQPSEPVVIIPAPQATPEAATSSPGAKK